MSWHLHCCACDRARLALNIANCTDVLQYIKEKPWRCHGERRGKGEGFVGVVTFSDVYWIIIFIAHWMTSACMFVGVESGIDLFMEQICMYVFSALNDP